MSQFDCGHLIAEPKNGVITPLYFDRQVVRASDLMLDRESTEAALARMRRLMHGWGVVSGLIPTVEGDQIKLTAGYAVAPSGAEIFMPDTIELSDIFDRIMKTCGPNSQGCELLSDEAHAAGEAKMKLASISTGAWLIARPASNDTEPRAGVPQGCAHPGNVLLNTRRCHLVQLELICTLPRDKLIKPVQCDTVDGYICVNPKFGELAPFPYPDAPGTEDDFVVLGYLNLTENGLNVSLPHRRAILPTSVLQDWMQSCVCPITHTVPDTIVPDEEPDDTTPPDKGNTWNHYYYLEAILAEEVVAEAAAGLTPDIEFAKGVPYMARELERVKKLPDFGIDGPETFLNMDVETLVVLTGLPGDDILKMKEELVATSKRWAKENTAPSVSNDWSEFNTKMADAGVSTNWKATDIAAAKGSLSAPPLLTDIVGSSAELAAKGLNGPADVLAKSNAELAITLNISEVEAGAIKTDMMRFVPIMAKGV
jgi:hypothetical protein